MADLTTYREAVSEGIAREMRRDHAVVCLGEDIGAAGGVFKTGRVLAFPGQPHNRLLLSILQAMGLPDTVFGEPTYGSQPLVGLT